jgi:hypothetical protein
MRGQRKTRRLPAGAWPKVLERYVLGERIEAIARDFGCSTAAIRGVIRRFLPRPVETAAASADPGRALVLRLTGALVRFVETLHAARRRSDAAYTTELREASDQLMRAIVRLRLEVEQAAQHRRS